MDVLMPPPPARTRAAKRGAAAPAESTLSNGSGGSLASKRPTLTDDGAASGGSSGLARPTRRSGRRGAEPHAVSAAVPLWPLSTSMPACCWQLGPQTYRPTHI